MAQNIQIRDDGTVDVGWNDFARVLTIIGYIQIPNHTTGILTFLNNWRNDRIAIQRENRYNVDYFLEIIEHIGIPPQMFFQIAFGRDITN